MVIWLSILILFLISSNRFCSQEANSSLSTQDTTSELSAIAGVVTVDIDSDIAKEVQTDDSSTNSTFEPSHDWQIVQPNQSIPAGCDVRMDLQTGKKEAKWSSGRNTHRFRVPQNYTPNENNTNSSVPIVSVLSDIFPNPDYTSIVQTENYNTTLRLIDMIRSTDNHTGILRYLDELELLLSDGDLALSIALTDYFQVLTKLLSSQNFNISSATSLVLGSMWQNNQQIQLIAIERNVLPTLLVLFQTYNRIGYDMNSILFATSTLLRGLPYGLGMHYFIEYNLSQILTELINNNMGNHRIAVKVIRFTEFLLEEYETDVRSDAHLEIRRKEMIDNIRNSGYCVALQELRLEGSVLEIISEFDSVHDKICHD